MEKAITIFLILLLVYFLLGVIFSIYFFIVGAKKLDPLIADSKWTVRLLFVPGAIALWAVLLPKILKSNKS